MKKYLALFVLVHVSSFSQVSDNQNYIKKTTPISQVTVNDYPSNNFTKREVVNYYDGLGRNTQNIFLKNTPNNKDLVVPVVYNLGGTKTKDYLPYPKTTDDFGTMVTTPLPALNSFYLGMFPEEGYYYSAYPYSEKKFESSPLNRLIETASPGRDWRLSNYSNVYMSATCNYTWAPNQLVTGTVYGNNTSFSVNTEGLLTMSMNFGGSGFTINTGNVKYIGNIPDVDLGYITDTYGVYTSYFASIQGGYLKITSPTSETITSVKTTFTHQLNKEYLRTNSSNTQKINHKANKSLEVVNYNISLNEDRKPTLEYDGHYEENKLFKTIIQDENWKSSYSKSWNYLDFRKYSTGTMTGSDVVLSVANNTMSFNFQVNLYPSTNIKTGAIKTLDIDVNDMILGNLIDTNTQLPVYKVYIENNVLYIQSLNTVGVPPGVIFNTTLTAKIKDYNNNSAGHFSNEYKDLSDRLILKRDFNEGVAHSTYHVYDAYDNLAYVIPPTASDAIDNHFGNRQTPVSRSHPWTALAVVDDKLAQAYQRLYEDYDNEFITSNDLYNQYGGQGGFVLTSNSKNELALTINLNVVEAMELKTGQIISLSDMGEFGDSELGRIKGMNYEYIFSIRNNALICSGFGKVNTVNSSFTGNTKLAYNKNYSWAYLADIDSKEREQLLNIYNSMDNADILGANVENNYNASGGINIIIDENNTVSVNLNITSDLNFKLKTGLVIPLNMERALADGEIGSIEDSNFRYQLSIRENHLYISGDGKISNVNFQGYLYPLSSSIPPEITEGMCYIYQYDKRNRVVEKKVPGKGWEYIVYDKLNRPVLSQDSNMRLTNKWMFTKYDLHNRIVYTGLFSFYGRERDSEQRKILQLLVDTDNIQGYYESRTSNFFQNGGININYTNNRFPNSSTPDYTILTVHYYDDYNFKPYGATLEIPTMIYTNPTASLLTNVKTLSTGSLVRVLETNKWILNLTGYDNKARPIWLKSINDYLQTTDITQIALDFTGKTNESVGIHSKQGTASVTIKNKYTYDHSERLLKHTQQIGSQNEELIAFNNYDELGQLISKKVGGLAPAASITYNTLTTALQTVDYKYNIRGWLKAINNPDANLTDDLFAFKVNYNTPELAATPMFNGNISETRWRTKSNTSNQIRSYKYEYDHLNRLLQADYIGNYQLSANPSQTENYSEGSIKYDKVGNILHLERYGLKQGATIIDKIDNLDYVYAPLSNKLEKVIDGGDSAGFANGTNTGNDYLYDVNGNMTQDLNKRMTSVSYNHLNLPVKIVFDNQDPLYSTNPKAIVYVYDALGTKLEKRVITGSPLNHAVTQYAGSFTYEQPTASSPNLLQFMPHAEGYVKRETAGNFSYVYQYKDHLGNIRLSYTKNTANQIVIVDENNYYPFGLEHQGYNGVVSSLANSSAGKYKYNGKEFQDELSLNWYDYQARNYDPAIGRWMNIDPLAETSRRWSPYTYCYNSPLNFIDPDGMSAKWIPEIKDNKIVVKAEKGDNAKTLAKFLGVEQKSADKMYSTKDKDGVVGLTNDVPGVEIINNALQDVADHKGDGKYEDSAWVPNGFEDTNYCCHNSSLSLLNGDEIPVDGPLLSAPGQDGISSKLRDSSEYKDVGGNASEYKFGQTLIRYGNLFGTTTHTATYLGTSKDGTIYTFSKEGNILPPTIQTTTQSQDKWGGSIQGLGPGKGGGFYNKL